MPSARRSACDSLLRAFQIELAHQRAPFLALGRRDIAGCPRPRACRSAADRYWRRASSSPDRLMIRFISACSLSTIGRGVLAGASSTCQDTASKSGALAASANGGTSGSEGMRVCAETASARSLPSLISGSEAPASAKPSLHMAGGDVGDRLRRALVGHVRHVEPEALLHVFDGKMLCDAGAGRARR